LTIRSCRTLLRQISSSSGHAVGKRCYSRCSSTRHSLHLLCWKRGWSHRLPGHLPGMCCRIGHRPARLGTARDVLQQQYTQDPALLGSSNLFLASFSCFGPTLACAGPGVGIISMLPDRGGASGLYMEMDGTSMASPSVCGALAAILAADPTYGILSRDTSRSTAARSALSQHCELIGLAVQYEGRGLPHF
jgi:hypothetical protein